MHDALPFAGPAWWSDALRKAKVDKLATSYGHGLRLQFHLTDCPSEAASFVIQIGHSGTAFEYAPGAPLPSLEAHAPMEGHGGGHMDGGHGDGGHGEGHAHSVRPLTLKMPRAVLAAIVAGTTSGLEAYSRGQLQIVGPLEDAEQLLNLALSRRFARWAATLTTDLT